MRCPKCGHKSFAQGTTQTVKDSPGRKEVLQYRVCSNPVCRHHFEAQVVYDAGLPPDPPQAA